MLQNLIMAKEESVTRSKEIVAELGSAGIPAEKRNILLAELESIAGPVRRKIIEECLNDLNNLGPLLRGTLLKAHDEKYEVEVDNRSKIERYGWELIMIDGKKMQFDPAREGERKYEPVPKMQVERSRTVYAVETNRAAVARIAELLREFLGKLKAEFQHVSIDRILDEKRKTEFEIAKVDRRQVTKENFGEADFQDADYIQRPARYKPNPLDQQNDLFKRFDSLKAGVPG